MVGTLSGGMGRPVLLLSALFEACINAARCLKGFRGEMSASISRADCRRQVTCRPSKEASKSLIPKRRVDPQGISVGEVGV